MGQAKAGLQEFVMRLGRSVLHAAPALEAVYFAIRLGKGPRSFFRYLRLLLAPREAVEQHRDPVEVRLRGLPYPVVLRPGTTDGQVAYGTLGMSFHRPPCALPENATIIDLGANNGLTAADYAVRYPRATVVAVEMDPGNADTAVRNTAPYRDQVTVMQAAAWWESTQLTYAAEPGEEWGFAVSDGGDHQVEAVAVGDLVEQYEPVDFLKIDIEGAEQEVLTRNTQWAAAVSAIQVEIHEPYTVEQCEHDLRELGFITERHPTHPFSVNGVRPAEAGTPSLSTELALLGSLNGLRAA